MTTMPADAWDLAGRAADRIVGRRAAPAVSRGVLAQWIAENGPGWPPPRRNPGNLSRGWAANFAYPFSAEYPNPQPGNPIVTFATLGGGADCYAAGLVAFPRYAAAVTRARAGDGLGFALAVCAAGYGTRASTVAAVYAGLAAAGPPGPPPSPGGPNVAIRYSPVTVTANHMELAQGQPLYDSPGGAVVTRMSRSVAVPHVGLAGAVSGRAWRAVVVSTRALYADGRAQPTVLYVPDSAGRIV